MVSEINMNYDKREKVAALVAKMNPKSIKARRLTRQYKLDSVVVTPVTPVVSEVVEAVVEPEPEPVKKTSKKKV